MLTALLSGMVLLSQESSPQDPPITTPKIVSVSMFKNGFAFLTREISVKNGSANVVEVPQSSLGTLWFWAPKGSVESITTDKTITIKKEVVSLDSLDQLLTKNVGKQVTVEVRNPNQTVATYDGKLLSASGDLAVIESRGETIATPKSSVVSLKSKDASFVYTTERETKTDRKFYRIKVTGNVDKVMMMSLEKGMTWAPGYALDITDPKKLQLVARATMLNDLSDLNGVNARLITGFPNLQFKDILEPLTANMSLDQWVNNLAGMSVGVPGGFGRNNARFDMMTQNAYSARAEEPAPDWTAVPTNGGQGEKIADLFFYDLSKVTLKKDSRSMINLFRSESDYEHIYCWDIDDDVQNNAEFRPYDPRVPVTPEEVWHALKFVNKSGQPLTTGPASVFEKGELVGQAQTSYVSNGAEAEIRINKALDIKPEQTEEEVSRERAFIKNVNGYPVFDLVVVKGTLAVKNMKREAVKIVIKKQFTGEFIEGSNNPTVTKSVKGLRNANPTGNIKWVETIEPGKSVNLTYQYKLLIRSQN